jgi:ABC-2 type transport system ATP-binding protein
MEPGQPLIEVRSLHKAFGEVKAVDGIDLQVHAGEIYGLVGPDGAGKTTLLRLLCGALRAGAGEAVIAGFSASRQVEQAREQLGYMPQRFSMYDELTVWENIRFFAEVRGLKGSQWQPRCTQILEFVGLAEFRERWAGQLSGGMRQKLGLAAALVHQPRVLLLDEPTTGVDPVTRQDFWQLIIRLAAGAGSALDQGDQRVAVLVSTPYMDEAVRCQRVGFIRDGRLLVEGTPEELRRSLQGRVVEWRGAPLKRMRQLAQADPGVEDVHAFGDRLHVRVYAGQAGAVITRLSQADLGAAEHSLRAVPAQLEDVFMALLGNSPKVS